MVQQTSDDPEFVRLLEEQLARRQIVTDLMALRAGAGLSQQDIADKLNCTQSRVSKLESSSDAALRLGDLGGYAAALGFSVQIVLTPRDWTTVDEVKYHAGCVKQDLDRLASLAEKDPSIARGVAGFLREARVHFGLILRSSTQTVLAALRAFGQQVPPCRQDVPLIRIEKKQAVADEGEPEEDPTPPLCQAACSL